MFFQCLLFHKKKYVISVKDQSIALHSSLDKIHFSFNYSNAAGYKLALIKLLRYKLFTYFTAYFGNASFPNTIRHKQPQSF